MGQDGGRQTTVSVSLHNFPEKIYSIKINTGDYR